MTACTGRLAPARRCAARFAGSSSGCDSCDPFSGRPPRSRRRASASPASRIRANLWRAGKPRFVRVSQISGTPWYRPTCPPEGQIRHPSIPSARGALPRRLRSAQMPSITRGGIELPGARDRSALPCTARNRRRSLDARGVAGDGARCGGRRHTHDRRNPACELGVPQPRGDDRDVGWRAERETGRGGRRARDPDRRRARDDANRRPRGRRALTPDARRRPLAPRGAPVHGRGDRARPAGRRPPAPGLPRAARPPRALPGLPARPQRCSKA